MIKIFKYLKEHYKPVIAIIILLIIQAICDLSLPQYTSNIVDIGIKQGGIESTIPDVIRESSLDKLKVFLNEDEQKTLKESYVSMDSDKQAEKYPKMTNEKLYELHITNEDSKNKLETMLSNPILMVTFFSSDSKEIKEMKQQLSAGMKAKGAQAKDVDIFTALSMMPKEQLDKITSQITDKTKDLSDIVIEQMAVNYVKTEYTAVGMDMAGMQNSYILQIGLRMIVIALLGMICTIFVCLLAARVAAKMGLQLRSRVFSKVVSFSNVEMDQFSTASLITRSTNDIQQIQMVVVLLLRMVFYAPILGIGGIIKVLSTDASMSWIIFVAVVIIMSIVAVLFAVAMPKFKMMQKLVDRVNLVTREILTGIQVIRAFNTVKYEEKRFEASNQDLTKNMLFTNRTMALMMPLMMFIMNGLTVVIVWFGAKGVDNGTIQVGDMIAFMTYAMMIVMSFLMLTMISIMLPRSAVAANRIDEILSTPLSIHEPKTAKVADGQTKGLLEFNKVHFRYPNAESDALEDITFTARPGQTTAFIGSTGSGKTTLINLIPRFYDVTEGSIKVNGVDVRELSQHDLRDKLGYVPQKGVLFSGTIDSNIRYGVEDSSEENVKKAAKIAQAVEFIEEKPEGYQSMIAQGGTNVSGGQKQRLSIARAIAKQPQIYIFDDSFSALDYKTDVTLRKALREEMKDSTVLIVAQRVSTIMQADQIIVLDDGRIAGIGTHKELLQNNDVYQQIAASQLSKEELENSGNLSEGGKINE